MMIKSIAVGSWFAVSVALAAGQGASTPVVTLTDLTLPSDRLPAGCALPPAPSKRVEPNTIVGGLWAGLPIATNPWMGADAHVMANIRSRMEPSLPVGVPDGPPLHPRAAANYHLHLADGLEAAYAAVYAHEDGDLVVVYGTKAVNVASAAAATQNRRPSQSVRPARIAIGSIDALVTGRGPCLDAVAAHVRSLAAR